jgi:integrase
MQKRAINKRKLNALDGTKLKPQSSAYLVWDTMQRGLALQVQPTGYRAFKFIYNFRNRTRWFHIGAADGIGLADARKKCAELMLEVLNGKDPAAEHRAGRHSTTFGTVHSRYLEEYAKRRNKSWRKGDALIRSNVLPVWGNLDASTITRTDVRAVFNSISGRAPILANQVLKHVAAIFSWAVDQEILGNSPCRGIELNSTKARERVLSDAEVPLFWKEFGTAGIPGLALKVLLFSGQRPGEVAHMRWEHIVDGWWEMPGEPVPSLGWPGTKNGASHRIALSQPVRALITELGDEASGFVFEKPPPLDAVMRQICRKLGVRTAVRPHDLRRTFSTTLTSLSFGRDALNRVTNHREGGIADVYDRHAYSAENQRVMEGVAARLLTLAEGTASTNVISFNR